MHSSLMDRFKQARASAPEVTLLLILLLFGLPMVMLIPPGAGYDEEDHLVRVWELSAFSLIPGQMSPQELQYPTVFRDFAYRQQGSDGVLDSEFWQSYGRAGLYERGFVRREIDTKSVYSPALLLPQAVAMRLLGRSAALPVLPAFYMVRLAGLLSYLLLGWLALRLIPYGKWIFLLLVASPIALFQAATLSPDAISNGIGFLFIAGCLRLAQDQEIGSNEFGTLLVLIFLLFLAKLNLIPLILLPFLLIPPSRFASKRLYALLIAITGILFLIEVAGWNWVASRNFGSLVLDQANPSAQLRYILVHPFAFLGTLGKDLFTNGLVYFQGWINGYGYYYWTPPLIVTVLFLIGFVVVLPLDSTSIDLNRRERLILFLVFLAGYVATIASLYISYTPVGADQVFGVQGRYFVPLALPLFLILASLSWSRTLPNPSPAWVVGFLGAALFLNLLGLFFSFHIPCGSTFYQTGLCYRPLFKDFPNDVHPSPTISVGTSLTQEFRVTCSGLAEVRLLVNPTETSDRGTTRFRVAETSSGRTLLDTSISNDQIPSGTWYSLRFASDRSSAGKQYVLYITGASNQGLQFLYTPQSEFNLGTSYDNEQPLEDDLVLQYGCATGLRTIWGPGKP